MILNAKQKKIVYLNVIYISISIFINYYFLNSFFFHMQGEEIDVDTIITKLLDAKGKDCKLL